MIIRKAEITDLHALLAIYNYEVMHGVATLDLEPKSMSDWEQWFNNHNINNHPLYVAEVGDSIAGYASLSSYRDKEAYKSTVELSVYISAQHRKQGVASHLMAFVLEEAKKDDRTHMVVSVITAGNEGSRRLHEKFGFQLCGTIPEVGFKFGKYQDIENYSLKV